MDKKELAVSLHNRKFNCCQSVICAFAQETGVDALTLFKMSEGFGLGMGGMECTCGALSGAVMAAGGIDPEDQKRIFERFFRVDKGRSRKMGGTGLGLSIVKHISAYYGGKVSLVSAVGEGSTFLVEIPMSGINKL